MRRSERGGVAWRALPMISTRGDGHARRRSVDARLLADMFCQLKFRDGQAPCQIMPRRSFDIADAGQLYRATREFKMAIISHYAEDLMAALRERDADARL